jgi:hypothetical protein
MRFMFVTYGYADIQCNSDDVQSFDNFTDVVVSLLSTDLGGNGGFQSTMVING